MESFKTQSGPDESPRDSTGDGKREKPKQKPKPKHKGRSTRIAANATDLAALTGDSKSKSRSAVIPRQRGPLAANLSDLAALKRAESASKATQDVDEIQPAPDSSNAHQDRVRTGSEEATAQQKKKKNNSFIISSAKRPAASRRAPLKLGPPRRSR